MSGRVVHFEIPFDDGDRARSFYQEAFGWSLQTIPEMSYTMVTSGPSGERGPTEPGFINGGMFERGQGTATGPTVVVEVESIDRALASIERLGGKTVAGRQAVGDMGFAAYFTDPEGNIVGLWEPAASG